MRRRGRRFQRLYPGLPSCYKHKHTAGSVGIYSPQQLRYHHRFELRSHIVLYLLYGSETWATRALEDRIAAFDNTCLRRILRIPYTAHATTAEVRLRAGSPPLAVHLATRSGPRTMEATRYAPARGMPAMMMMMVRDLRAWYVLLTVFHEFYITYFIMANE